MDSGLLARPAALPSDVALTRTVGPFDAASLPPGLLREHRLREGSWGLLRLQEGQLDFVWDDAEGGRFNLRAPAEVIVPPCAPHHLELDGPVLVEISFYRAGGQD